MRRLACILAWDDVDRGAFCRLFGCVCAAVCGRASGNTGCITAAVRSARGVESAAAGVLLNALASTSSPLMNTRQAVDCRYILLLVIFRACVLFPINTLPTHYRNKARHSTLPCLVAFHPAQPALSRNTPVRRSVLRRNSLSYWPAASPTGHRSRQHSLCGDTRDTPSHQVRVRSTPGEPRAGVWESPTQRCNLIRICNRWRDEYRTRRSAHRDGRRRCPRHVRAKYTCDARLTLPAASTVVVYTGRVIGHGEPVTTILTV